MSDLIAVGTATQSPSDILAPIIDSGIDLATFFKDRWLNLERLFFRKEVVTEPTSQRAFVVYKMKGEFGKRNTQKALLTSDGAIEWIDVIANDPSTEIAVAASATNSITVSDVNELMGIKANSDIIIVTYDGDNLPSFTKVTLTADPAGNVLALNSNVTAPVGAKVYRGVYNRAPGCSPTITNTYTLRTPVKDKAYFRKIDTKLEFTKLELNMHRYVYDLDVAGAQRYIEDLHMAQIEGMLNEFRDAVYTDKNVPNGNGVTPNGASQTMGLLPKLQDVQENYDIRTIHNLGACCTAGDVSTIHDMIRGFLTLVQDAGDSGLYEDGVITIIANNAQLAALQELQPYLRDYANVTVMYDGDDLNLGLPKIQYGAYTVEWMYEEYFDKSTSPFFIMLPKDQVVVRQQKYQYVGADMKVKESSQNIDKAIGEGYPMIRMVDRTAVETTNLGDCFVFLMEFEFAVGWRGTGTGAYHACFNFALCDDECDVITPASVSGADANITVLS